MGRLIPLLRAFLLTLVRHVARDTQNAIVEAGQSAATQRPTPEPQRQEPEKEEPKEQRRDRDSVSQEIRQNLARSLRPLSRTTSTPVDNDSEQKQPGYVQEVMGVFTNAWEWHVGRHLKQRKLKKQAADMAAAMRRASQPARPTRQPAPPIQPVREIPRASVPRREDQEQKPPTFFQQAKETGAEYLQEVLGVFTNAYRWHFGQRNDPEPEVQGPPKPRGYLQGMRFRAVGWRLPRLISKAQYARDRIDRFRRMATLRFPQPAAQPQTDGKSGGGINPEVYGPPRPPQTPSNTSGFGRILSVMRRNPAPGSGSGAGAATGQGSQAASSSLGRLAGSAARAAGVIVTVISALWATYKAFVLFGQLTVQSRERLREFNGTISAAFSRLDTQRIQLGIREGKATKNSTADLVDAMRELNESTQGNRQALMTLVNTAAAMALRTAAAVSKAIETINFLIPLAKMIEENTRKNQKDVDLLSLEVLKRLASGQQAGKQPLRPL